MGILGSLLAAWLALPASGSHGLADGIRPYIQIGMQLLSIVIAIAVDWTVIASHDILQVTSAVNGLRVDQKEEIEW